MAAKKKKIKSKQKKEVKYIVKFISSDFMFSTFGFSERIEEFHTLAEVRKFLKNVSADKVEVYEIASKVRLKTRYDIVR